MRVKGITRKLDNMGRIVIPRELRKALGVEEGQQVEMVLVNGGVLVKADNCNNDKKLEEYTKEELIKELSRRL